MLDLFTANNTTTYELSFIITIVTQFMYYIYKDRYAYSFNLECHFLTWNRWGQVPVHRVGTGVARISCERQRVVLLWWHRTHLGIHQNIIALPHVGGVGNKHMLSDRPTTMRDSRGGRNWRWRRQSPFHHYATASSSYHRWMHHMTAVSFPPPYKDKEQNTHQNGSSYHT